MVDLLFERMLREVGAEELEEVADAGAVKGGDRAAVGSAEYVVSWSDGCAWMANLPVGSMSRSGLMGSWLNVIRGCDHGGGPGSGRMGAVEGTKP